jgi:hypothetical protein
LITDGFIVPPSGNISLELPNDIIELQYEKNYGQPTVQIIQYINKNKKYVGKSQFLNKKQVDKIFGIGTPKAALYKTVARPAQVNPAQNAMNNTQQNTSPANKTPKKRNKSVF